MVKVGDPCEHTVTIDGQPTQCRRPIVDTVDEVCDRPGDHVEEESWSK